MDTRHIALKRTPGLLLLAALLLAVLLLLSPMLVQAATTPVRVNAAASWVPTGIIVAVGDVVSLEAHGQAITGPLVQFPGAKSGPAGQVWNDPCGVYVPAGPCALPGAYYGLLIGKIGVGGTPFAIGDTGGFTALEAGELYLAVNDNTAFYGDNSGGFIVLFK